MPFSPDQVLHHLMLARESFAAVAAGHPTVEQVKVVELAKEARISVGTIEAAKPEAEPSPDATSSAPAAPAEPQTRSEDERNVGATKSRASQRASGSV